jgi:hypothetical protein
MSRETAYYDDQSKGGGGYKISRTKSKNPDQEAMETLGIGFGAPLAAAGIGAAMTKRSKDTDTEASDKEQREAAAELKRESRGKKSGGSIRSASSRADGIAARGKTRGKMY